MPKRRLSMKNICLDFSIDEIRELLQPLGLRLNCTQDKAWNDLIWSIVDRFGKTVWGLGVGQHFPNVLLHAVEPYLLFNKFMMSRSLHWISTKVDPNDETATSTVMYVDNPYFGCKSLEEALIRKDLLGVNRPQDT